MTQCRGGQSPGGKLFTSPCSLTGAPFTLYDSFSLMRNGCCCGLATFTSWVMVPELLGGITLPDGLRSCNWKVLGTAAWKTKSVMGKASEFVAVTMMDTTLDGLPGTFSNAKIIFKPFFSKAVMGGKPEEEFGVSEATG